MSYKFQKQKSPLLSADKLWNAVAAELQWHSLLILQDDVIVFEKYAKGHSATAPHVLWSLSKSFTSMGIGIAIDEGLLTLDTNVCDIFKGRGYSKALKNIDVGTRTLTVRHLLTMNTGRNEGYMNYNDKSAPDSIEAFFTAHCDTVPGTHFCYSNHATFMLSAIIKALTGQTLCEYLTLRLFEPLEITPRWDADELTGNNFGAWGLHLTTRDIAALGRLLLRHGDWNGRRIVSAHYVKEATKFQVPTSDKEGGDPESDWGVGYGYQFWQCNPPGGTPKGVFRGDGMNGQFCIVNPSRNLVAAVTGNTADMGRTLKELYPIIT